MSVRIAHLPLTCFIIAPLLSVVYSSGTVSSVAWLAAMMSSALATSSLMTAGADEKLSEALELTQPWGR